MDIAAAGMALLLAFLVRFGPDIPPDQLRNLALSLPIVMAMHTGFSCYHRTYALSWRYFSVADVRLLAQSAALAAACSFVGIWMLNLRSFSRGVMVLYGLFCVAGALSPATRTVVRERVTRIPKRSAGPPID